MYDWKEAYKLLGEQLAARNVDIEQVKERVKQHKIETPSWAYSDSGTRFGVYRQPGAALTLREKLEDAGMVNKLTGVAPTVAVHVLWDFEKGLDSVEETKQIAEETGVRIGAINPNLFQPQEYKLGSFASPWEHARKKAIDHTLESIKIGEAVGSKYLSMWFADGTNFPGQDDFVERKHRMLEGLKTAYDAMPSDMTMLLEYKFFEPAFYGTDIPDWGTSYLFCTKLGERAKVLVDLGHHAQGVNIEQIVANMLDEGMLGGFHFNNRKYADDDLTVASINPYEFFLIYKELVDDELNPARNNVIAYMVDQCHSLKNKIEEMIQTVVQIQIAYAKAHCIDRNKLKAAQAEGDIVTAEMCLIDAYNTDVTPLLYKVREELDVPLDPIDAYRKSGYQEKIEKERGIRTGGGLGA